MAEPSIAAETAKRRRAPRPRAPAWPPRDRGYAHPWPPFWEPASGRLAVRGESAASGLAQLLNDQPAWAPDYAAQALATLAPQSAKTLLPALAALLFAGTEPARRLGMLTDRLAASRLSDAERNRRLAQAIHHAHRHDLLLPSGAEASVIATPPPQPALANVALAASLHELERAAAHAVQIELSLRPMVLDGRFQRIADTLAATAPDLSRDLTQALGQVRALLQAVRNISCARHMLAEGQAGDSVAFDAGRHRLVHTPPAGQALTTVRLLDPAILALRPDGQKVVLCQAVVEPVKD